MAKALFLREEGLRPLLESIEARRTVVNARIESDSERIGSTSLWLPLEEATDKQLSAGLRSPRPVNPFKGALLPIREIVAHYGKKAQKDPLEGLSGESIALVGMRGSDCRALGYLDKVMFREPMADPFYKLRRESCTVVSVDCVSPCESCFCNLYGEKAYAEANFDLNLSPIEGGYLLEAGSEKGEGIIERNKERLGPASEGQIEQRIRNRQQATEQLERQNAEYAPTSAEELARLVPDSLEEVFWLTEMATCVQCGGCTAVCPTCYCFLLSDKEAGEGAYERREAWDSCQFTGYSEMAGPPGTIKPDPRRTHMSKFQRRFSHKFWYDVLVNEMVGCVGCGRCRDTCPGAIDLRRVITSIKSAQVTNA